MNDNKFSYLNCTTRKWKIDILYQKKFESIEKPLEQVSSFHFRDSGLIFGPRWKDFQPNMDEKTQLYWKYFWSRNLPSVKKKHKTLIKLYFFQSLNRSTSRPLVQSWGKGNEISVDVIKGEVITPRVIWLYFSRDIISPLNYVLEESRT